jgi:hypothetical protein
MTPRVFFSPAAQRGSALLATIVLSVVFLTLMVWFLQWSHIESEQDVHEASYQRALYYAESGFQAAEDGLKLPDSEIADAAVTVSSPMPQGSYEYTLLKDSSSTTSEIIHVSAAGYFDLPKGSQRDPLNGQPARRAKIQATLYVGSVAAFAAVAPGELRLGPGVSVDGIVYSRDLVFEKAEPATPIRLDTALFSRAARRFDGVEDSSPVFVSFTSTPKAAQRLLYPPHFLWPGSELRHWFEPHVTDTSHRLWNNDDFRPGTGDGASSSFYFCDGDLHLARNSDLVVNGPTCVYVTGTVTIHRSIQGSAGGALIVYAEKDIPLNIRGEHEVNLQGTFITAGAFVDDGFMHPSSTLHVYGSLLARSGIDLGAYWTRRVYQPAGETTGAPQFTQLLDYHVVEGR